MRILLVSCGGRFGSQVAKKFLTNRWEVYGISSSDNHITKNYLIDWNRLSVENIDRIIDDLPELDAIFFNQNSNSGPSDLNYNARFSKSELSRWNEAVWINTQMPAYLVYNLKDKLKKGAIIGWMDGWGDYSQGKDDENWNHAGYAMNKVSHKIIMRCMHKSTPYICYTANFRDHDDKEGNAQKLFELHSTITRNYSGEMILL